MSDPFVMPDPVDAGSDPTVAVSDPFVMPDDAEAVDPFVMTDPPVESTTVVPPREPVLEVRGHSVIGDVKKGFHNMMAGRSTMDAERQAKEAAIYERMAAGEKTKTLYDDWKKAGLSKHQFRRLPPKKALEMAAILKGRAGGNIVDSIESQDDAAMYPAHPDQAAFDKTKGWVEPLKALTPGLVGSMIATSFGGQIPTLPYMLAGLAGRIPMAAGMAVGGMQTEATASSMDIVRAAAAVDPNFNIRDTEAVTEFLKSPQYRELYDKHLPKAMIIGLFEGIGGLLASMGIKGAIKGSIAQAVAGGATGGLGDALGSVAIGEKINPQSVYGEVFAEAGMQVPTAAGATVLAAKDKAIDLAKAKSKADLGGLEAELKQKADYREAGLDVQPDTTSQPDIGPEPPPLMEAPQRASEQASVGVIPEVDQAHIMRKPIEDQVRPDMEASPISPDVDAEPVINEIEDSFPVSHSRAILADVLPESENQPYGETEVILQRLKEGVEVKQPVVKNEDGSYTVSIEYDGSFTDPLKELAKTVQKERFVPGTTPLPDNGPTHVQDGENRKSEKDKARQQLDAAKNVDPTNPYTDHVKRNMDISDSMNDLASLDLNDSDFSAKLDKVIYTMSDKPKSIGEWIQNLIDNAPDRGYALIAERAAKVIREMEAKGMPITIRILGDAGIEQTRWSHHFSQGVRGIAAPTIEGGYEVIIRSSTDPSSNGARFETILHEIVHVATMGSVNSYMEGNRTLSPEQESGLLDLIELTDELKKLAEKAEKDGTVKNLPKAVQEWLKKKSNVLDDPNEVLAWGLTNPDVRAWLRTIEFKKTNRSMMGKWYTAVRKFFALTKNEEKSALGRLFGIYNDLTNEGMWEYGEPQLNLDKETVIEKPPLNAEAIHAAVENYKQKWTIHSGMVGGLVQNPFEVDLSILHKLNGDAKVKAKFFNFDDPRMMIGLGETGKSTHIKASKEPGAFTLVAHPKLEGNGKGVIFHSDNPGMLAELKKQYPNLRIMSMFEAKSLIKNGKATQEAAKEWKEATEAGKSLELLEKISDTKKRNPATESMLKELDHLRNDIDLATSVEVTLQDRPPDLKQNFTDILTSGVQHKATMTGHPIIKALRKMVKLLIAEKKAFERNVLNPMQKAWVRLSEADRVKTMKALLAADKHEVDLTRDMLERHGFTPEMIQFIEDFRKADQWLYEQGNINLAAQGLPLTPRRAGHFPGLFNNDYQTVIRDKKDGSVVMVLGAKSRGKLRKIQKDYLKSLDNPDAVVFGGVERKGLDGKDTVLAEHFFDNLDNSYRDADPALRQKAMDAQRSGATMGHHFLGFSKHEKAKSGVEGSAGRKPWLDDKENAQEQFEAMMSYLKQGQAHHAAMPMLTELGELFENPELVRDYPNTLRYISAVMSFITQTNVKTVINHKGYSAAKALGTALDTLLDFVPWALGRGKGVTSTRLAQSREVFAIMTMGVGNLSFAAMQVMQVPLFGIPMYVHIKNKLPQKLGLSMKDVMGSFQDTSRIYQMVRGSEGKDIYKSDQWLAMTEEERTTAEFMLDNAMISVDNLEEQYKAFGGTSEIGARFEKMANWSRTAPEQFTRPLVFYSLLKTLRKNGVPMKEARDIAMNATQAAMFSYDQMHRPMVFSATGQFGRFFGQLQVFVAGSYGFLGMMGLKPTKHKAMIATFIMTWIALSGLENLPGADETDWLVRMLTFSLLGTELSHKKWMRENLHDSVRVGALAYLSGIDIHSRTRMKTLNEFGEQFTSWEKAMGFAPAFSFWGKMIGAGWSSVTDPTSEKKLHEAIRAGLPSSARYIADYGFRRNSDGDIIDSKAQTVIHVENINRDFLPSVARLIGLQPQSESDYKAAARAEMELEMKMDKERQSVIDQYRDYLDSGRPLGTSKELSLLKRAQRLEIDLRLVFGVSEQERRRRKRDADVMERAVGSQLRPTRARGQRENQKENRTLSNIFNTFFK